MNFLRNKTNQMIIAAVIVLLFVAYYSKDIMAWSKRTMMKDNTSGGKEDGADVLKKGDTGVAVTKLQNGILSIDEDLLPKYGADGVFGQETENALVELYGKKSISLNEFEGLASANVKPEKSIGKKMQIVGEVG